MRTNRRWLATGLLPVAALLMTACGSSASPGSSGAGGSSTAPVVASGPGIKTVSARIGTVLTNSSGKTLYWFVPDTATASNCSGRCAKSWPPVKGPVSAAAGVSLPDKFGTITRADGSVQATYDGHPLYTFSGDQSAGMTSGNKVNNAGGLWWAMTPTGAKLAGVPAPKPSSPGGGGGYGY